MNSWQIVFLILSVGFAYCGFRTLRDWAGVPADVARYFLAALIAMLFVALTACSTPAVRTQTVTVQVPVATHPVAAKDVPQLPSPLPKRPADARSALDLALAQVCRFVAYGLKADPLLRLSAGLPPQEAPRYPECER